MFGLWETQNKFNRLVNERLEWSEKVLKALSDTILVQDKQIRDLYNEIGQLKQQLSEKEVES